MADDTKLGYSSDWDIDQLIATGTVAVPSGASTLYTFTGTPPLFEVQFKPTGQSIWYSMGLNSTDGTTGNEFRVFPTMTTNSILLGSDLAGTARYFVWTDKVQY